MYPAFGFGLRVLGLGFGFRVSSSASTVPGKQRLARRFVRTPIKRTGTKVFAESCKCTIYGSKNDTFWDPYSLNPEPDRLCEGLEFSAQKICCLGAIPSPCALGEDKAKLEQLGFLRAGWEWRREGLNPKPSTLRPKPSALSPKP